VLAIAQVFRKADVDLPGSKLNYHLLSVGAGIVIKRDAVE
jgi:hypothetical protein